MKPSIDFWFSIGSTYTYLSVMRLPEIAGATGIRFVPRPFSVRAIMREMDNIPFANKPAKAAYMWRDIERRAARYGFTPRLPAPYPLKEFDLANRVAIVAAREGWCDAYLAATYRRWIEEGEEAGSEPNLSASIAEAGEAPSRVVGQRRRRRNGDGLSRRHRRGPAPGHLRLAHLRRRRRAVLGGRPAGGRDRVARARTPRLGGVHTHSDLADPQGCLVSVQQATTLLVGYWCQ